MNKEKLADVVAEVALVAIVAILAFFTGAYLQWSGSVFFEDVEVVRRG